MKSRILMTNLVVMSMIANMGFGQELIIPLHDQTQLIFASEEQGREIVGAKDDFVQRTRNLERQIRLDTQDPVSVDRYLEFLKEQVRAWKETEIESVSDAVAELKSKLSKYDLPFPKAIYLVRASADMEAGAPHCRGAAIVLPDRFFGDKSKMITILTHELFHVLSSHNPELRNRLYAIIGFAPCSEITLPDSLKARRLTNPDAPKLEHYINLQFEDQPIAVVPITVTRTAEFQGGGLFRNLDLKLMEVEELGGSWQASLHDGKPRLISPRNVPDYMRKIGRNTGYIIHPEETLADNFWMMVLGKPGVPDPWVMEKMSEILGK